MYREHFRETVYRNYEVIVLDNESHEAETLEYLAALGKRERVHVERIEGAFNYSRLNNRGVELSRGSLIALLNNDVEVISNSWLSEMVSHALRPEVGMVGARLWYEQCPARRSDSWAGGIAGHAHVASGTSTATLVARI
jgi:glycosyltransferase involved in cell wall biosynthesis